MKILITGSNGFIGKNMVAQLSVRQGLEILSHHRRHTNNDLRNMVNDADFICHLAGVNRPQDEAEFAKVNTDLTKFLCDAVRDTGRKIPIVFASSVHAERAGPYGKSKLEAEKLLIDLSETTGTPVHIFRLPHVIGKWCRPNYNSVVATFCYNIAHDLPIEIDNPDFLINVVYVDDFVLNVYALINNAGTDGHYVNAHPSYPVTVGELADIIRFFKASRQSLITGRVGQGLMRALHATYVSYLDPQDFAYPLVKHEDPRGMFVEMLKTPDSGQFSFFTAHPGVTRGGHFHHSKTEKFLVVKGRANFRFKQILTGETYEIITSGDKPEVVETIPGWAHDITNIGDEEMIVMLWANEIFDKDNPDTYYSPL
jgi:UDP-2-acetamido-2,6-beta-L-arabino-hexul-4-ose reductase